MERINYDMLFRGFVGLSLDDPAWYPTTFTKNRDRLLAHDVDGRFLAKVNEQAQARKLLSRDHFSLDGTLLDACAPIKSFRPKKPAAGRPEDDEGTGGSDEDFRGMRLSNATHQSTTDPDARLYRKGKSQSAKLCHMGHALVENRSGMVVGASVTAATGTAEREADWSYHGSCPNGRGGARWAATRVLTRRLSLRGCRDLNVTPHAAAKRSGGAVDGRTTRHGAVGRAWSSARASRSRLAGPRPRG